MTEPAAIIQGSFADLKVIKTRKVVQVVVEIPIEKGAEVVDAFGFPQPESEVWLALARLDVEKAKEPPKERKPFSELPLSQQAALRCQDTTFMEFLGSSYRQVWDDLDSGKDRNFHTVDVVRMMCCNGLSRSTLDTEAEYAARWNALNAEYEEWAGLVAEER